MPDDHSKVAPLLPIPNRTVKRLCADDSADSRVKVGHRQALTSKQPPTPHGVGGFSFARLIFGIRSNIDNKGVFSPQGIRLFELVQQASQYFIHGNRAVCVGDACEIA